MIVQSIIDTDLYKFTTSYAYFKSFPQAEGTFVFHDRENTVYDQAFIDRLNDAFADLATDCICPPSLPICVCNHRAKGFCVNKKPILPSEDELKEKDFIRTHQSYLVNAQKIKSVSKDSALLVNGFSLPVSKSKATKVKDAYLWSKR